MLKLKSTTALIAAALCCQAGAGLAQSASGYDLGTLTIWADSIATRDGSRSSVSRQEIEQTRPGADVATLLQDIPGVTTQGDAGDGEIAVNIRGLQDHGRVAVTVDGVRQNFARSGHAANGTFSIDPEMLREVSVTRGPGGKAGAIGGSVEFRTVTADDLIAAGDTAGTEIRLRHGTLAAAPTLHAAHAWKPSESVDLTFAATRAEADDYTAADGTRVYAKKQTRSALATIGLTTEGGTRLAFSVDSLAEDYVLGQGASTVRDTDLRKQTFRLTGTHADVAGWAVEATLYATRSEVAQSTLDPVTLAPTGVRRSYDTRTDGLLLEAGRVLEFGGLEHALAFSLEAFRDTVTTDDAAGSLTPSGTRDVLSLSLEDRIDFGPLAVTLGLSLDHYSLSSAAAAASGGAISPRIALLAPLGESFTLHAAAALTFRSPSLNETLVSGLHPPPASFEIRPNPDLRPERARSLEIGIGYSDSGILTQGDRLDLRATLFRNDIRDYIELEQVGGIFNAYFQYQNVSRARIDGLEFEARYDSDRAFASLTGQILDGTDQTTGLELSNVPPARMIVTAGLRSADARQSYGARLTVVGAKDQGALKSRSWRSIDLFYTHALSDRATFSVALNNITDETYTPHLQTQPKPGFNALASLAIRF